MLRLGGAMEAPQDHIMVCVVPGFPEGYVPEQTAVCPENIIFPGQHLPALPYHSPIKTVLRPWDAAQGGVTGHVLQDGIH